MDALKILSAGALVVAPRSDHSREDRRREIVAGAMTRRSLATAVCFSVILACGNEPTPSGVVPTGLPKRFVLVWPSRPSSAPASSRIVGPGVQLLDANDIPVKGITVTWSVTAGGGSLDGTSEITDADGISKSGMWQLGPTAGTQSLSISAAGISGTNGIPMATTSP